MTNTELLAAPRDRLTPAERQRQHALRSALTPVPCPACRVPVDALSASGTSVEDFRVGQELAEFRCPRCDAKLDRVGLTDVAAPGWHWRLEVAWLDERLQLVRRLKMRDKPCGWVLVQVGPSRYRVACPDRVVGGVWCLRCRTDAASLKRAEAELARLRAEEPLPEDAP